MNLYQLVLTALALARKTQVASSADPVVTIADGTSLQGTTSSSGSVHTYLGVPYALPPVGDMRWVPPQPWVKSSGDDGPLDVTSFGQACTQRKQDSFFGGEDCLFLNVFVHTDHYPVTGSEDLPVALWLHGGTYMSGDASQYDAQEMINLYNGHVIVVTVNYRLNIFGFLGGEDMRSLDAARGSSGTLGLQDQRLAMKWVQSNIASFGGSKDRVTLFGQSAGAGSISAHLTMDLSRGLFSAAVLESGAFASWGVQNFTNAQKVYESVLREASCGNLTCLQDMTTNELYEVAQRIDPVSNLLPTAFIPSVDSVDLLTHPWVSLSAGNVSNVPILLGTNSDEGVSYLPESTPTTLSEFEFFYMLVREFGFGDHRDEIEWLYVTNASYPEELDSEGAVHSDYWWAAQRFIGDYFFSCPVQHSLDQLAPLSSSDSNSCSSSKQFCSDMFVYHNEFRLSDRGPFVQHGFELPLVFHFDEHLPTDADTLMADTVAMYWGNFFTAHDPSPQTGGLPFASAHESPSWPPYSHSAATTTTFSNAMNVSSASGLKKAECTVLRAIMEETMRREYPHSYSADSSGDSGNDASSGTAFTKMLRKYGVVLLVVCVCALLFIGYAVLQRRSGLTHQEAQQFLALRGNEQINGLELDGAAAL